MLIHSTSSFNEKRALQRELIDGHKANAFRTQNIIIEVKNWPINCVREQSLVAKQRNLFIICWIRLDKAVLTTISQKVRRTIYKVRRKLTLDRFLVLKLHMNFNFLLSIKVIIRRDRLREPLRSPFTNQVSRQKTELL